MQPKGRLPEGVHSNGWGSIFLKLMFLSMWAERFRMQLLLAVRRGLLPIRFRPDFCPAAALGLRDSWWQAFLSDAWQVLTIGIPHLLMVRQALSESSKRVGKASHPART